MPSTARISHNGNVDFVVLFIVGVAVTAIAPNAFECFAFNYRTFLVHRSSFAAPSNLCTGWRKSGHVCVSVGHCMRVCVCPELVIDFGLYDVPSSNGTNESIGFSVTVFVCVRLASFIAERRASGIEWLGVGHDRKKKSDTLLAHQTAIAVCWHFITVKLDAASISCLFSVRAHVRCDAMASAWNGVFLLLDGI